MRHLHATNMKIALLCVLFVLAIAVTFAENDNSSSSEVGNVKETWFEKKWKQANPCYTFCEIKLFEWFRAKNSKGNNNFFSSCCTMKRHNCEKNTDYAPVNEKRCPKEKIDPEVQ